MAVSQVNLRYAMGVNMDQQDIILSAKDIEVKFDLRGQILTAIRGVSLDIYRGETLAIVGESGSGKSVFTKTFNGLLDANGRISEGELLYHGENLAQYKKEKQWLKIRGHEIAMIMQEPMTSLNPLKTIGEQIVEAIRIRDKKLSFKEAKKEALGYLKEVGIKYPERRYGQYPHEFSGGMRQRVVIAIAVACKPKILICDEPTTALDVTIQAQILKVLKEMKEKHSLTIIFITHDLGVVASVADRIAVMYAGDIIEIGMTEEIFFDPRHPYTWALLSSMPQLGIKGEDLFSIQGNPPNLFTEIKGDAFAPRNPHALKIDYQKRPPYFEVSATHKAKTWLLDPRAPKVEKPAGIVRLRELKAN
ncbi:MAG: ABC-type dipeptide/oligopeptide/nickel transport system, ATPase component [Lachnospiraceae bacterium]|jgi:oligopeptide transport system ATP-binding protein|nr:ABC-type dipeptide/oligopeptide/nickel transport system, ATPase component [Lachnospiraceae bacterium]